MAGIGIDGLISGQNTTEVITKLMELERKPLELLNTKKESLQTEADAWRELNTRLYALQEAAYKLQSIDMFKVRTASVADSSVLSVTAANGAQVAAYNVEIKQLAKAHAVTSDAVGAADEALAPGLVGDASFSINGKEVTVTADDTLETLTGKINSANAGVNASVVKVGDGQYKLVMTSKESGTANAMTFEDGDNILQGLGVLNSDGTAKNQTQEAKDAIAVINGLEVTRSNNVIDDAVSGVTFTLKKEGKNNETVATDVTIEMDNDKIVEAAKDFVEKYNAVMEYIGENNTFTYDKSTKTGSSGPLFGDSTLTAVDSMMRSLMSSSVEGVDASVNLMSLIGIKSVSGVEGAKSGKLEFDEETFRSKLESNTDDVAKFIGASGTGGAFTKFYNQLFDTTSSQGALKTKTSTINHMIDDVNDQITSMEGRLEKVEARYYTQFNAMEVALAKLQTQSSYISSMLAQFSSK